MKAALALYLARHFAKGKISEAIFMAIAVAAAVFTTASAVNAAIAFQKESATFLARPDYLEIQAAPAAFVRSNDEAVERLDEDMARAFSLAPDLASRA
ncbi:MAG: hypothetical protein KKI09_15620, partial [Spirochaetes bacterium]|nr:hypothetical protein [Spirochaetota bacterium]